MHIAFYGVAEADVAHVQEVLAGHDVTFHDDLSNPAHMPDPATEVLSVFTTSPVPAEVVHGLPNLKLVTTRSTGYDHIDVAACKDCGIAVANVPGYGAVSVAEYTFGLLLALSRKIPAAIARVQNNHLFDPEGLTGFDLSGKTLGVLGTGHIGASVIRIAKAFGMEVLAFDAFPNDTLASELGFTYQPLEQVLAHSHIVTVHVPYMPETHHLLNAERLALMPTGGYVVNTARGAIIDTEALIAALSSGHLAGAALDVLEEEGALSHEDDLLHGSSKASEIKTLLADHALIHMPNVLVSPHNAFNTIEARRLLLDITLDNIKAFAAGKPTNVVTV
jgi:D-lactate dehydrogenase